MEITNEIKAKLFAQYLGQKFRYSGSYGTVRRLEGVQRTWNIEDEFGESFRADKCTLLLKPLTSITDADIKKMCVMLWGDEIEAEIIRTDSAIDVNIINTGSSFIIFHDGEILDAEREFSGNRIPSLFFCYQLLQQLGYDLPHYLLGGKTLKESGIAIYE